MELRTGPKPDLRKRSPRQRVVVHPAPPPHPERPASDQAEGFEGAFYDPPVPPNADAPPQPDVSTPTDVQTGVATDVASASRFVRIKHDQVGPHRKGATVSADQFSDLQRLIDLGAVAWAPDAIETTPADPDLIRIYPAPPAPERVNIDMLATDVDRHGRELTRLNGLLKASTDHLEDAQCERDQLSQQVRRIALGEAPPEGDFRGALQTANARIEALNEDIATLQGEITRTTNQLGNAERRLSDARAGNQNLADNEHDDECDRRVIKLAREFGAAFADYRDPFRRDLGFARFTFIPYAEHPALQAFFEFRDPKYGAPRLRLIDTGRTPLPGEKEVQTHESLD